MSKRGNGEGSVYQRADGKWCGSVSLEGGKRKVLYGRTRQEVAGKLRIAQNACESGTLTTGRQQTVAQFFARWLEDSIRPAKRQRTYESYEEKVRLHVLPELGRLPLPKLTPQHLQRLYAAKLSAGLSPKTVSLIHAIIHHGLKQALRWGVIGRNVAELVDAPPRGHRDPTPLSGDQLKAMRQAIRGHRHEPLWVLLPLTGLRFGEAAALRWSDVDLNIGALQVAHTLSRCRGGGWELTPPKTSKSRRAIPLPVVAAEMLRQQRRQVLEAKLLAGPTWTEHDFVFTARNGSPLREAHVLSDFHKALQRAGLPRFRLHDLRHTYATRLFERGRHPRDVQDLLGHSRIEMTMNVYTESIPARLRDAAASLENLFGDPAMEAARAQ